MTNPSTKLGAPHVRVGPNLPQGRGHASARASVASLPAKATSGFRRPDLGFNRAAHGAPKTLLAGVVQKGPSCFGRRQNSLHKPVFFTFEYTGGGGWGGALGCVCGALRAARGFWGADYWVPFWRGPGRCNCGPFLARGTILNKEFHSTPHLHA